MQQRDGCAAAIAAANLRLMRNKTFRIVKRCPVSEFGTAESLAPSPGQGISANLIFMPSRHRIGTFEGVVLRIGVWLWRPSFACNCAATRRGCRRGLLACA